MHRHNRTALAAVALAMITVTAACGSSAKSQSGGDTNYLNITSADRQTQLETAAKTEGQVTWYTSLAGDVVTNLQKSFEAAYPGVKVNVYRADGDDVITHVTQEAQAHKPAMDVIELDSGDLGVLSSNNLLQPFYSPETAKIPAEFKEEAKTAGMVVSASDRLTFISFGYNTDAISADHVPTSLQDLLDPYWKGKLAMTTHSNGPDWVGAVINQMGESQADTYFQQLHDQGLKAEGISASAVAGLVAAGTIAASPGIASSHVEQQQAKGAPIKWVNIDPVVAHSGQVAIGAQAPDPAAAVLFADFLLGDKGGAELRSDGEASPLTPVSFQVFQPDRDKTPQQYAADEKSWTNTFNKYFGAG